MQRYTKEEIDEAKKFLDVYLDLVERNNSKFYLADNVVLDWFGKTIKGDKKVSLFIKEQVCKVNHDLSNVTPSEDVSFKDTHQISVKNRQAVFLISSPTERDFTTPSTSTIESPAKKMKFSEDLTEETVESETEKMSLKYLTAEGSVEFHRPSLKKLQSETRWRRPVKLHLGYTSTSIKDCTIYLIIYEGNLKCRRNLYKELCEAD